jgi:hypothetical protein
LGVLTKRSSALLASDVKPATFWTANPNNFWRDNVAAHSHAFGFWIEPMKNTPDNPGVCPFFEPLGEHRNNTLRSHNSIGMRIYPQYTPLIIPCDPNSAPSPMYIHKLLSYRNGANGIFSKRHGNIHHIGHTLLENGAHEISIMKLINVTYDNNPFFKDVLLVGTLDKNFKSTDDLGKRAIFAPQHEYFYASNITFVKSKKSRLIDNLYFYCEKSLSYSFDESKAEDFLKFS